MMEGRYECERETGRSRERKRGRRERRKERRGCGVEGLPTSRFIRFL